MTSSKSWLLCLLALPAGGLGWLLGGSEPDPDAGAGDPPAAGALSAIEAPAELPDFFAADADGNAPSFCAVSLRLLKAASSATQPELRRLRDEVSDARYQTDPAYHLVREVIDELYRDRFGAQVVSEEVTPSSRNSFFLSWGYRDLQAAFDAAMVAEPANHRNLMLIDTFTNGAGRNPALALKLLRSISDPTLRDQVAWSPVRAAVRDDPSLYRELAEEFPQLREYIYETAFANFPIENPKTALAELDQIPAAYREKARAALLDHWGRSDHAAVLEWARENEMPLPPGLFHSWAATDPIPALEAAVAGQFVQDRYSGGLDAIVAMATEKNPDNREQIAEWLVELEDPVLRARLSIGLLHGEDEPSEALLDAARLVANDPNRAWDSQQTLEQFADRIGDARARREWIQSLTPSASRSLMSHQAERWLKEDPSSFESYVNSLPTARAQATFMRSALRQPYTDQGQARLRTWAENHLGADALKRMNEGQP